MKSSVSFQICRTLRRARGLASSPTAGYGISGATATSAAPSDNESDATGCRRRQKASVTSSRRRCLGKALSGNRDIPADPLPVFRLEYEALLGLYEAQEHRVKERTTKRHLWLDMLRIASMEPPKSAIDRLFVTHSFLITIARGVIESLAHPNRDRIEAPESLREGFAGWIVDTPAGTEWSQSVFNRIHTYEWRRYGDVLRPLYEALVDEHDRKVFGEYYTPDWLAELMVEEILDDEWCQRSVGKAVHAIETRKELRNTGVLDPCCGSGTFLYHAARRILKAGGTGLEDETPGRQAQIVARLVNGIDIHPVAAELGTGNATTGTARAAVRRARSVAGLPRGLAADPAAGRVLIVRPEPDHHRKQERRDRTTCHKRS